LAVLHCERFVDCSPAQVWATLLDEGRYLASERNHRLRSELMRALHSHTRHLATLGRALAAIGCAPKTVHLLDYCNDPVYRRAILRARDCGIDERRVVA
jgi:TnpA family transposase